MNSCRSILDKAKSTARHVVLATPMRPANVLHDMETQAAAGDLDGLKNTLKTWDRVPEDVLKWTSLNGAEYSLRDKIPNDDKRIILHRVMTAATAEGHVEIVRFLMEDRGCLPYMGAIRKAYSNERWDIAELFLESGWDINASVAGDNTRCPLMEVLHTERKVRWFLEHGADPMWRTAGLDRDVCSEAARKQGVHILQALRDHGADLPKSNALHGAALGQVADRVQVLAYLLDIGFPINQREMEFDEKLFLSWKYEGLGTALHSAVKGKCVETLTFLLNRGADQTIKDTKDRTPLDLAREMNFDQGVSLLGGDGP